MIAAPWLVHLAASFPRPFAPERLHRLGLEALAAGDDALADALFEGAAAGYRLALRIEPLARVRVHQRIARWRAARGGEAEAVEIERQLARLDRIEALEPPFALVDAHALLARWIADAAPPAADPGAGAGDAPATVAAAA